MIADLKPYPAMKDSGVEWLRAVPEHWEVRQLASDVQREILLTTVEDDEVNGESE